MKNYLIKWQYVINNNSSGFTTIYIYISSEKFFLFVMYEYNIYKKSKGWGGGTISLQELIRKALNLYINDQQKI